MKMLTVVGARPQFIKAAVVIRAIQAVNRERGNPPGEEYVEEITKEKSEILRELGLMANNQSPSSFDYALVTLHRAENTDNPQRLRSIFKALDEVSQWMVVIFPLHPRTKKTIEGVGIKGRGKNLRLIGRVSYFDMLLVERNAKVILTDSGGVRLMNVRKMNIFSLTWPFFFATNVHKMNARCMRPKKNIAEGENG